MLSTRSFVHSSVTNLVNTFENDWTDFAANWHDLVYEAKGSNFQLLKSGLRTQEVKVQGHTRPKLDLEI